MHTHCGSFLSLSVFYSVFWAVSIFWSFQLRRLVRHAGLTLGSPAGAQVWAISFAVTAGHAAVLLFLFHLHPGDQIAVAVNIGTGRL